ncbi:MAG: hypothetical protein HC918_04965 [Oscillatoriales cyanobacterium SM2_1_8]|nr:hypothetical protein [Oscillatoriales cyanobacterium SM2_1_8]
MSARENGTNWDWVPHVLHRRRPPRLKQRQQRGQRWMQSSAIAHRQPVGDRQLGPQPPIVGVSVGNERVESIVPPHQLHHQQCAPFGVRPQGPSGHRRRGDRQPQKIPAFHGCSSKLRQLVEG